MAVKRKTYRYRGGTVIDVEEFHDGRYGAPGKQRTKRAKPTEEQMRKVNAINKARRCRMRLLEYFDAGDCFATWTYEVEKRPPNMDAAKEDFKKAMRKVRAEYKKRGYEVYWIKNIEHGTKGAWHIHLVINEVGDTASILQKAWEKGGTWFTEIKKSKFYDEDFTKLANYITKDEHSTYRKEDGALGKTRIREASYSTSRNMPLPKAKSDKLMHWKKDVKPKKGYYIASIYEGINPVTHYKYRRYTMFRIKNERRRRE